jgi:hypothetical protein
VRLAAKAKGIKVTDVAVNNKDDFSERVNYATACISNGRIQTRRFFGAFEMNDADEICTAIYRRSLKNERLAAKIWKALDQKSVMDAVERLKDVPTRRLAEEARKQREAAARPLPPPAAIETSAPTPDETEAVSATADEAARFPLFNCAGMAPRP